MRLKEKFEDSGGGGGTQEVHQTYLPTSVTQVTSEVLKSFSHTKRVGNYLLGKTLGEGSFAKVKEGMHSLTGEKVAVKVIDKKKAKEDAYVRKNLRREGKLLQMVRHRHVVRLFEIMETENSYYLVTELCQGGDLMEHICNKKKLDEKETRKYVRQILSAVDYLHKAGILHRDLKVENLLLDQNRDVKIIDFGLSNAVDVSIGSDGKTTFHEFCVTQCGSPAYAAPELLGNHKYGPSVDIWSIGVNMFAMLTGSLPFTVEPFNIKALHKRMQKGEMNTMPDHLSQHCRDLVRRFLNPDPEKRITILQAMKHPWVCEGYSGHVESSPFPNRLCREDLVADILKHMNQHIDVKISEIVRLVTGNIPNASTATYSLLSQRLKRHEAETQLQARIQRATKLAQEHMQSSNFDLTGNDVIELTPIQDRDGNHHWSPRPQTGSYQPARVIDMNLSPRRLPKEPEEKQVPRPAPTGKAKKYRLIDQSRETSPARSVKRDVSPRRVPPGVRRGSMDHSPAHSPRSSPKKSPSRRGSLEPPRRGSFLPRSQSQETDGSSVAPSDIVLPELDLEPEESLVGTRGSERHNLVRPVPVRPHATANQSHNLPSLNAFTPRLPTERSSPGPHPKHHLSHFSPSSNREGGEGKHLSGKLMTIDRNNNNNHNHPYNREAVDRLSPSVNCSSPHQRMMMGGAMDLSDSHNTPPHRAHNSSSHSTGSSVGRNSGSSNVGGGGYLGVSRMGGVGGSSGGGGLTQRYEDSTQPSQSQSPKSEWRNVKATNNRVKTNLACRSPNELNATNTSSNNEANKVADSLGRKLVIDTGQYDRYARASGRIRTITQPPPSSSGETDNTYQKGQKRLISLMYPSSSTHRPRHVVPKKGQYLHRPNQHVTANQSNYPIDNNVHPGSPNVNNGDNYLGVTGERASGGRTSAQRIGSGVKRQNMHQNQRLSPNHFQEPENFVPIGGRDSYRSVSPINRVGASRSPSPSYYSRVSNNHEKVALPAISPTHGLSSYSGRMHVEDLDRQ